MLFVKEMPSFIAPIPMGALVLLALHHRHNLNSVHVMLRNVLLPMIIQF